MTCTDWTNRLIDRAQPATARAEAAQKLARKCRDYTVWQTLCSIAYDEDEVPAVRCGAVQALSDWNRYAAVNFLTRAFYNSEVRAAAVATLEKMGPVEGEMEVKLLSDLSALRRGATDIYIEGLASQYNKDATPGCWSIWWSCCKTVTNIIAHGQ